jgi:hypothetical protein
MITKMADCPPSFCPSMKDGLTSGNYQSFKHHMFALDFGMNQEDPSFSPELATTNIAPSSKT